MSRYILDGFYSEELEQSLRANDVFPLIRDICHKYGVKVLCEAPSLVGKAFQLCHTNGMAVGKDLLGGYERFYKVSETMCKAMNRDAFLVIAKEVIEENKDKYFEAAEALRDQAPLDAMILYAVALEVGKITQQIEQPSWYQSEPHEIFCNLKRHMNKRLYKEHPEVFTPVHYGKGEVYPPSIWGYEIEVNGEIVQQY